MSDLEYAVKAETHEGNVMVLRRGFASQASAEDHPVKIALWRRVWVEPIGRIDNPSEPVLPPLPWNWVTSERPDARGQFYVYLVDATGRKIAAIWGKDGEKKLTADYILQNCNTIISENRRGNDV